MNKLEQEHIDFLKVCADEPNKIHKLSETVSVADANSLAAEGLLIEYNKPNGRFYAIGRYGAQFVKELRSSANDEMTKLAVDYVISKGFEAEIAKGIVNSEGVERILRTQAEEMKGTKQREVIVPTNDQGNPEIKFRG